MNEKEILQPTHNIKQLGFSGLRGFGSRSNFFQRWIGTQPENPTVSYCKTLACIGVQKKIFTYSNTYPQNENNYTITPFLPIF
jgi:hypothetical protein